MFVLQRDMREKTLGEHVFSEKPVRWLPVYVLYVRVRVCYSHGGIIIRPGLRVLLFFMNTLNDSGAASDAA